jgi:hypothetical protein
VRAYLDLDVVTSMYYILISLDEYVVDMVKYFSTKILVLCLIA